MLANLGLKNGHFKTLATKTDILTFLENKRLFVRRTYISLLIYLKAIYVTLHGISGNKVNARTRHVLTRSHANGMTRLPCGYAHKNN